MASKNSAKKTSKLCNQIASSNGKKPEHGLSLCMIVRNEEKQLRRCLESVKEICDEMIIVDTGSTDSTVKIASQFTDKIYHHPWENSFSIARNHSLSYANFSWILQLDADEILFAEDQAALLEIISDSKNEAFYLQILNDMPTGGVTSFSSPRVFRNSPDHHFEGCVHNRLVHGEKSEDCAIRIRHFGYALDQQSMQEKFDRSVPLLRSEISSHPEQAFPKYYLATFLQGQAQHSEAIKLSQQAIEIWENDPPQESMLLACCMNLEALALAADQQLNKAEERLQKIIERWPDFIDAYFDLAKVYLDQNNPAKAIELLTHYFKLLPEWQNKISSQDLLIRSVNSEGLAHNNLACAHENNGDLEKAEEHFRLSLENCPELSVASENLARLLMKKQKFGLAAGLLQENAKRVGLTANGYHQLGICLANSGQKKAALELAREFSRQHPLDPKSWQLLSILYTQDGESRQAALCLKRVQKLQHLSPTLIKN